MSEIKRLLNSLLWEIYGRIPSNIARKHNRNRHLKMHNRLYEPRLLEKLGINVLNDICAILKLEIRLMSRYLERVLISRDKNRTQQTILYGFLDVIVSSRLEEHQSISLDMSHLFNSIKNLAGSYIQKDSNEAAGESSREMRFNLSPPTGSTVKGRGDGGRPIITDETNSSSDFNQWLHAMKMVARLPGGMPPEFRRKLWLALAEKYLKSKNVDWEKEEIKCFSEQWREDDEELGIQIVKDLHRTGSSLCSGPAGTINQAKLKRILLGYARYNPEVGYCQGFNMLGALILQVMDKEEIESIKVMIYLVEGILPRGYFSGSLGGLQADMAVFRELMTCKLPRLAKHLQKLQGPVENAFEPPLTNVFTMQWFLTMFCTCLPMTCVLRVWDLVLIEGSDVLLRTALVLWSLLEERILNARTADDFYCKMGSFSSELLNGHLIDSNGLIEKVVDLGPIPELQKLRDKHLYNISPFRDKKGLQLYYSDEEGDSDEDSRMAVATAWGLRLSRRGSAGLSNKTDGKDRIALDISLLKKQYDRLRERQRQAHIILTSAVARQGSNPNQSTIQMNQLLIGRNAIVTNNGRRLGPPQGAIPPARKPSLPTAKSPKLPQTKTLRRGETLHWRDTELSKRRRGSLKWKDIKSDSSQSGQDDRPPQMNESAPSSRSSSSEPKSQRGSLKTRQRSDSSSYSEDSDGNSSTSTSLCDEDDHETGNLSSLEGSPMKKSKKKHSEVPHKKCLEDVLNSNEKPHSVDSQIPFIQLTTMDSPVLNANKTEIDSLEYSKEDSETESNRLDYAGFVDEYSWPDMNEPTNSRPLEDVTIDVSSNEGDFLSLSNAITSTSQLSPIPDITTYINNSNISPLRTPISAFDYANLVVSIDDSKKFDVNDEGVTNEYFERINIVERPTKLDLLYSLNEEDSIRNAYKMTSCQSSPELAEHEEDAPDEKSSPKSSKFLIYEQSNKQIPPSTEEMDRKMKVLLEYSNQSSLSFIAEAKHEISSGMFKEKEFDSIPLKYQSSALVPSNRASADIKPTTDETTEHIFVIPTVEKKVIVGSVVATTTLGSESPVKSDQVLTTEGAPEKVHSQEVFTTQSQLDDAPPISILIPVKESSAQDELEFEKKEQPVQDSFNADQFVEDAECQIPSTEDLEMRFKALEKSFTDRKGSSSRAKSIENDNKPAAKTLKELDENEAVSSKFETTAVEPSGIITELTQKPSIEAHTLNTPDFYVIPQVEDQTSGALIPSEYQLIFVQTSGVDNPITPLKNQRADFTMIPQEEDKNTGAHIHSPIFEQTSGVGNTISDQNQTLLMEEKNKSHCLDAFSKEQSIKQDLVPDQMYDIDKPQYSLGQYKSTTECESKADCDTSINVSSFENFNLNKSTITSTKNVSEVNQDCLTKSYSQSDSHNEGNGLETSVIEETSDSSRLGIKLFKDESDVEKDGLNKEYSQLAYQNLPHSDDDIIKPSLTEQTSCTEKTRFPSAKDESQVDEGYLDIEHLKQEIEVKEGLPLVDDNLQAQPLCYSQDHFGDKVISKPTFESSSASQSSSIFNKQNIEGLEFEAKHSLESNTQNMVEKDLHDKYSDDRQKLENSDLQDTHVVVKSTVGEEHSASEHVCVTKSLSSEHVTKSPTPLSYSEDHFGENNPEKEDNKIETKKQEKASNAQLPKFFDDHMENLENLSKQSCISEMPSYQVDNTTDRIEEKASSKPKFENSEVSDNAAVTHPQNPKIPTTEDLETRFMTLERELSKNPVPNIVNQPHNEDLLQTKDSVIASEDILPVKIKESDPKMDGQPTSVEGYVQVKAVITEEQKAVATKPIPSTADLEHRFRELERKLSSTNMNSSLKASSPQEDNLKALRQSNIVTNPSIVLPNNEESTPSSTKISSKNHEDQVTNNQPPFIRKRIPSTEDLESRFQALEIQKSLKSPTSLTSNLLSPSKSKTDFAILAPEVDPNLKRKSDIPSTQDLETRFQALNQIKHIQTPLKDVQNESKPDSSIPSTKDLETRFQALEQRKSIVDCCTKTKESDPQVNCDSKTEQESKIVPSTLDLEMRFQALEQKKSMGNSCTKSMSDQTSKLDKTTTDKPNKKDQNEAKVPSTEDLETRYEALEHRKSISNNSTKSKNTLNSSDSKTSADLMENKRQVDKVLPSTEDLESRFEALEKRKSINGGCNKFNENQASSEKTTNNNIEREADKKLTSIQNSEIKFQNQSSVAEGSSKTDISQEKRSGETLDSIMSKSIKDQKDKKLPSTKDLEFRFNALEQQKATTDISKAKNTNFDNQSKFSNKTSEETEKLKPELPSSSFSTKHELKTDAKVPSTQDLETRFEALEKQKPKNSKDSKLQLVKVDITDHKILSKVPSTHDLEKRFDNMQIDAKKLKQNDSKIEQKKQLLPRKDDSPEPVDQHKRKDLYKLESQSDETLTATDQTSTEFETKTESRPTSCPEHSDPFDSNIVTTDRVLKIIEENSKILHRILKKTLADAGDCTENNTQSKKSSPGITDSLLALGNIFPRSDETISPSRIKSHSWIRPSITLRSDDNISDRLASIKSTIKSIDTLCEEKSFRKEKCQRYIDSLFARPTITTTTPTNPSIKVDDFECKPSQERVPKRELKKDISPRRRRDEEREEYESRVRRDMMPNSLDTSSDLSFSLANIEQVDSEVDRINQGNQVDTQMERPLSPYYVSGYDLNKRSITPVVYIPTKLEIRHTTVTSTFYDRYLTEKHIERTFPRTKKSPVSPTITKSYLDISNYSLKSNDRSSKSAENSPSRRKDVSELSPNETASLATNKRNLVSTLDVTKKDLHIRSCDNILLQLRSSTNKEIVPSIMVYNPLPAKIKKPPELGISLGLYKDYGSDESSKS